MGWDFSTDPQFQKKLDWVEEFCREEVEPLEYVFPYAVRSKDPKIRALVKGLQDEVKAQGLWAIFLDEELGGPGYGQLKLGLLNEILGRYPSAPFEHHCNAYSAAHLPARQSSCDPVSTLCGGCRDRESTSGVTSVARCSHVPGRSVSGTRSTAQMTWSKMRYLATNRSD